MLVLIRRRQTQNAARYDRGLRRRAVSQDLAGGRRRGAVLAHVAGGEPGDRESESLGGCWLRPENDTNKQSYGYKSTTDRGLHYCSLHLLEPATGNHKCLAYSGWAAKITPTSGPTATKAPRIVVFITVLSIFLNPHSNGWRTRALRAIATAQLQTDRKGLARFGDRP